MAVRAALDHGPGGFGVGAVRGGRAGLIGQQGVQALGGLLLTGGLGLAAGRTPGRAGLDLDPVVGGDQGPVGPEGVVAALPELPAQPVPPQFGVGQGAARVAGQRGELPLAEAGPAAQGGQPAAQGLALLPDPLGAAGSVAAVARARTGPQVGAVADAVRGSAREGVGSRQGHVASVEWGPRKCGADTIDLNMAWW